MTKAKTAKKTTANDSGRIVGSTAETDKKEALSGADVVTLRVALRISMKFDSIPDGDKKKTIVLPSLDEALRGKSSGILTSEGNAIFYQLKRSDWEAIQKMYGQLQCFHSYQGRPPLIAPVESATAAKSGAYREDIEATDTKLGQQDPTKVGVTEDKDE